MHRERFKEISEKVKLMEDLEDVVDTELPVQSVTVNVSHKGPILFTDLKLLNKIAYLLLEELNRHKEEFKEL